MNVAPTPEQLAEITIMAAQEVKRFGIVPKIALLSHSNCGTSNAPTAQTMRDVLAILKERAPDLEVDGEMHGDLALDARLRREVLPESTLEADANLLILPNVAAGVKSHSWNDPGTKWRERFGTWCVGTVRDDKTHHYSDNGAL